METACEMALSNIRIPRYHHLKSILSGNQDQIYLEHRKKQQQKERNRQAGGYIRGASYYGGYDDDK